ncbi:hypothetical protein ACOKFD_12965 [Flagellimonas sp. S174]|uniref:hypothetical protein n=1 Tax=Flagellimonas sp. S174 TaxID=3410790 RepID=UPI003BF5C461
METFISFLHFAVQNRFLFLILSILTLFLMRFAISFVVKSKPKETVMTLIITPFIWAIVLIFFFGTDYVNKQIYTYGKMGEGMMVDRENTGNLYNEQPIIRYEMLIKAENGEMVETSFESNDFNLYPKPDGSFNYPLNGETFNVRYLDKNPEAFVIVTDDNSRYSKQSKCEKMLRELKNSRNKRGFDIDNASFKENYRKAIANYLESDCIEDSQTKDFYIQEMSKLE